MTAAAEMILLAQAALWQAALVFLRIGAIMALMPGFGEQSIPTRIKLALTLVMTLAVMPALPAFAPDQAWELFVFTRFALTEAVNGLAIGLGMRLFILALQTAGSMAAQATSLSQVTGGVGAEPMPAIGHILVISALALMMMLGLHLRAIEFIVGSYLVIPAGTFPNPADLSGWGIVRVARAFSLAFTLAAPFVIMSVLYNLILGVINRAMPQLMVAFVGAPVITFGGLGVLFLIAPTMLTVWREAFGLFLSLPIGATP